MRKRNWEQLAKDTLDAQDSVDLAHLSKQLIEIIFDVHENLLADGKSSSFAAIQQHPICKAWAQIIFKLTCASPGLFGFRSDLHAVEILAFPPPNPESEEEKLQ
jgi:hypothetical protein